MSNPVFRRNDVFAPTGPAGAANRRQFDAGGVAPSEAGRWTVNPSAGSGFTNPVAPVAPGSTIDARALEQAYGQAPATAYHTGRLTYDDVVVKTAALLGILVVSGVATWWFMPQLTFVGIVVGLVLGLICGFKRNPSPPLIVAYAVFEGMALGGISGIFDAVWSGIVLQAVVATLSVFGIMLFLHASGRFRATPKGARFVIAAMLGYLVFCLINFALQVTGVLDAGGLRAITVAGIPLGIVISLVAVLLGAYSLLIDFSFIQNGVENGIPRKFAWSAAFGLVVSLVWLYLEFLRLLSYFRD